MPSEADNYNSAPLPDVGATARCSMEMANPTKDGNIGWGAYA